MDLLVPKHKLLFLKGKKKTKHKPPISNNSVSISLQQLLDHWCRGRSMDQSQRDNIYPLQKKKKKSISLIQSSYNYFFKRREHHFSQEQDLP